MKKWTRPSGRKLDELRQWNISCGILDHAEGSALIDAGKTRVLCAATVEDKVPQFLKNMGRGWVTAEYSMLPRSTHTRSPRERGGRIGGRTLEIQRLIGRSLRCVTDLTGFGEKTITVDCDVIQADGGTRVASITAAWIALHNAFTTLQAMGHIHQMPLLDSVAAVSVGIVENQVLLDLDYDEDSAAEVDMNVVMTGRGKLVEVQATAEGTPFSVSRMNSLIRVARTGLASIEEIQMDTLRAVAKAAAKK
ncbi:MAG TPA: ribonuclease PH [Desulfomonilaceae bacterium]|nr:ribonuclease PH [Desulfomonilaceae bacterium]